MKKKNLLLLAIGAFMSLTSCGGASNVDQYLPTDDPTTPVTITFWECLGHAKGSNLGKVVDAFNKKYEGKYEVVADKIAGDYSALHDAIKTKVSAGEIPALTMGYPDSFSEYITKYIENSQILRLDNFIKDSNYGYSQEELNDFVAAYYNEGNHYQFEGVWSMPMYKSTEVMYYNYSYFMGVNDLNAAKFKGVKAFQDLYDEAYGRTFEAEDDDPTRTPLQDALDAVREYAEAHNGYVYDVPTTWSEMVTLARKMVADRAAVGGTVAQKTFFPIGYDSDANLMISQMAQKHIPYTINDAACEADPDRHFAFVNSQAKQLATDLVELLDDKILITKGSLGGSTYTNEYFNNGQTAMTVGSTGGSSYNISSNFAVKLAPVPYSGDAPKYIQQGPSICFFDNNNEYIHKGAWLFYKELASTATNTSLSLENSYDPIRKSCYETQQYKDWIDMAGQGLKYDIPSITSTLKDNYMTSEVFIGSGTARTEIGNILKYVYLEGLTVDKAFEKAFNICKAAA